jgi:NAD(P)H-dependent flavin oxidoreductase YrpB (nitropropane dioxygenase family)
VVRTAVCDLLGMEYPIFAFSHCRDVVAAVTNAGGFGVLGAIGFSVDELEAELAWIDERVGSRPYGVDIVIPARYEGMGETDPVELERKLEAMIPEDHRRFARRLLEEQGVPELPPDEPRRSGLLGWTEATAGPLIDVALSHDRVRLVANALGTPPEAVIARVQRSGRAMAALAGSVAHARRHRDAGVDLIVCQGSEGGGHTGDVGSIVLWPEVIDAVAPTPVLAAGGIGSGRQIAAALAMGAQGVWTGTLWLTVQEADVPPQQMEAYLAATSRDTVRSRAYTGKPCRMLKNAWTEAWDRPDTPDPLPMPLQMMVAIEALSRSRRYPQQGQSVAFSPCGQVIGAATKVRRARDVVLSLVEEYLEAVERLSGTRSEPSLA